VYGHVRAEASVCTFSTCSMRRFERSVRGQAFLRSRRGLVIDTQDF